MRFSATCNFGLLREKSESWILVWEDFVMRRGHPGIIRRYLLRCDCLIPRQKRVAINLPGEPNGVYLDLPMARRRDSRPFAEGVDLH